MGLRSVSAVIKSSAAFLRSVSESMGWTSYQNYLMIAAMSHEAMQTIDIHAHYFPQPFLDLIAKYGASHGFEYKMVEGKGPQFKRGYITTGPVTRKFIDLDTRL